ncbi:hypothetical protein [Paenibacillus humicola]|uniref:hypothetical protein n=1 Tax=Paenibacillus humicola TaxID=3110540 RepID=UPI00237BE6AA|nr:hypothetical protein [Paenibacillus humicola]
MTDWQGAWALFKHELRHSLLGLLITLLFFVYMAVVVSPLLDGIAEHSDYLRGFGWAGDFVYLTLLPNMGFMMSANRMRYWKTDFFSRKLAYWRILSIGMNSIVMARILMLLAVMVTVGLFYFTLQYAILSELRSLMSMGEYAAFACTWLGYALLAGSTYMYFEQTCKGKVYLIVCFSYLGLYVVLTGIFALTGTSVLEWTIEAVRDGNRVPSIVMPLAGFAFLAITGAMVRKRLAARSLLD